MDIEIKKEIVELMGLALEANESKHYNVFLDMAGCAFQ